MEVADYHFCSDFFHLDEEFSCLEIPVELTFEDGEFVFNELSSRIYNVIEPESHFLTIRTPNSLIIPGPDRDDRIRMEILSDQSVNRFRIVSPVHDVTIGLLDVVTLAE